MIDTIDIIGDSSLLVKARYLYDSKTIMDILRQQYSALHGSKHNDLSEFKTTIEHLVVLGNGPSGNLILKAPICKFN